MKDKKLFNHSSEEAFNNAKVIGGNPNGIINFNETNHKWATICYKNMRARDWSPAQVNISKDINNYSRLEKEEKRMYDLLLAQLITDDSIQTNQLMDRINAKITSPVVNACISRQAYEESLHSFSYAVMAEDIAKDTKYIYDLHNHCEELQEKNKKVEELFDLNNPKSMFGNSGQSQSSQSTGIPANAASDVVVDTYVVPNLPDSPIPIRTPAQVMRIWVAPWEDSNGDFVVDPGGTGAIVLTGNITHTGTQTTTGQLNVDNLRMDGGVISSTSGSITLTPASGQNQSQNLKAYPANYTLSFIS